MTARNTRLLIIGDTTNQLSRLCAHLREHAFEIIKASNAAEGLAQAIDQRPDLILLDLATPGLNGFTLCAQLKKQARSRQIPIILLSEPVGIEDKLKGFAAGCVDFITRPFFMAEMLARLTVHLHIRYRMESLEAIAGLRLLEGVGNDHDREGALFIKAIAILEQRLTHPPGLIELARELGTNQRKLSLIFRRRTGMTVFGYLTEIRLESARRLLENSQLQIRLIADKVGYANAGDFTLSLIHI